MFQIGQKLHSIIFKTALILLLPTIFNWFGVTMNESDEAWRKLQQKYEMIKIGRQLYSIKKQLVLSYYCWWSFIELLLKRMGVMNFEGECIDNIEIFES